MLKSLKDNLILNFILFSLLIFVGLVFFQKSNNALPFFYKNYPTYETNGKEHFDSTSEALVLNRIDFSTLDIEYGYRFNLWRTNLELRALGDYHANSRHNYDYITTPDYLLDGEPYRSQLGFQSLLWVKLADIFNAKHGDYFLLKLFSALLLSLSAASVLLWMKINFRLIPSLVGLSFFILSTGVNIFSQSLYWSVWLFFLPLSVACLLDIFNIKNKYAILLLMLPIFLIKFLSGYEFITVIVLAAMTPYAWDFLVTKNTDAAIRALFVGISSVIAFLISLFIYNKYFFLDFNSSGFDFILGRSGSWSVKNIGEGSLSPFTQASKILVMNFIDFNGYGIPLGGFLILTLATMLFKKNKIRVADINFIAFLLLSSLSWFIVQPHHILFHPRYAMLMFFLPFGFFVAAFITSLVTTKRHLLENTNA